MPRQHATDLVLGTLISVGAVLLLCVTRLNALLVVLTGSFAAGYAIGRSGSRLMSGAIPCVALLVWGVIWLRTPLGERETTFDNGPEPGREAVGLIMVCAIVFMLGLAGRWVRRNIARHDGNS